MGGILHIAECCVCCHIPSFIFSLPFSFFSICQHLYHSFCSLQGNISASMLSAGKPTATSWVVAAGVNAAVLGYVSYKLYRTAVVQHEKHKQLKRSAQRLWRLATQVGVLHAGPSSLSHQSGILCCRTDSVLLAERQPLSCNHWVACSLQPGWCDSSAADCRASAVAAVADCAVNAAASAVVTR